MELQTVTTNEVLIIHEALTADFAESSDPILPPGVKKLALLESAVGRQLAGGYDQLKYPNAIENAATLLFGICNNHAFQNGNKRTAVVAMLVHLDKNDYFLARTIKDDLFKMILAVANHTILDGNMSIRLPKKVRESADAEVAAVAAWIRKRAEKKSRGERQITYRDLRRLLGQFGFELESDSHRGNSISIFRLIEEKRLLRRPKLVRKRIGAVGYRDEGTLVSIKDIKKVRELCELDEEHGIDSSAFYDQAAIIDSFINKYRRTLRRLARR